MIRAGAAEVDITPELGIQIAGDIGRPRPAEAVADPLYAKALIIENDVSGLRLCILAADVLTISNSWARRIRDAVAEAVGVPVDCVMLHASQTHSAPSIGHLFPYDDEGWTLLPDNMPWLKGGDDRYNPVALAGIVEAATRAASDLRPATLRAGRAVDGRVSYNRRFVMRDGSTVTHARSNPNVMCCEGPTDPEVAVVLVQDQAGATLASLLHHTCHPTHGYPTRTISADWCGAWSDEMKQRFGSGSVNLVINGCCGNIAPADSLDPDFKASQSRMGTLLAESADRAIASSTPVEDQTLGVLVRVEELGLRELKPDELDTARQMLAAHPRPAMRENEPQSVTWDWLYAVARLEVHERWRNAERFRYIVQGFRLGSVALLGLMGEPFVEGQLAIKIASPAQLTLVAHMCNGYAGYVPTGRALTRGGYETRTATWSRYRANALGDIVRQSDEVLGELWGAPHGAADIDHVSFKLGG